MATTTRLPHAADTPHPPGYGTLRRDETPAEGWDDPSAAKMDAELDEQAQEDLEHLRDPYHG